MSQENDHDVGATTTRPKRGPSRMDMVADYLPDKDQWEAKTNLDEGDPGRVAALNVLHIAYPEVDDMDILIEEMLQVFLPAKTSRSNKSRDEYKEIFRSLFGGRGDDSTSGRVLAEVFGADLDGED